MDLRQLECFVAVAEELHFGRAADRLHLAQPAVSQAIRRFEAAIGGRVFERTTRSVALTPLGEQLLADARRAHRAVEAVYLRGRDLAQQAERDIRVGYADDVGLQLLGNVVPVLAGDVRLRWRQLGTIAQLTAIRNGELDAGIGVAPELDDDLASMPLGVVRLVAVVPQDHPLTRIGVARLAEIDEPLLFWQRDPNPTFHDVVHAAIVAAGRAGDLISDNYGLANIASRAVAGDGVGIAPASLASQWHIPGVAYVPFDRDAPTAPRLLCWLRSNDHPGLARFVDTTRQQAERGALRLV
ncbi:MAG: LysR family transcriptional regulator [Acidimicrobiales bacterium]|nr:LysR family transcriptional regulator [Acidimicrobiales bacterium]